MSSLKRTCQLLHGVRLKGGGGFGNSCKPGNKRDYCTNLGKTGQEWWGW